MKKFSFLIIFISIALQAQVGIGTTTPNPSSILHMESNNKGVLIPKVSLTSYTDQTTILNPAVGLLVYNTGLSTLSYEGFVYWNGFEWRSLLNGSTETGSIDNLNCSNAKLSPLSYTAGVSFSGFMSIPYSGGNGGFYEGQVIGPVNGLTASLSAGYFNVGAGELIYEISGTPLVSSPITTSFAINIGGQSCTAIVGQGEKGFIQEYAQVNFESYGSSIAGTSSVGTLADILPGAVNIARVKRVGRGAFRIDFAIPFQDDSYIVAGYGFEPGAYNGDNTQPYLYIPNFTRQSNALGQAIMNDTDVSPLPTNPGYNLNTRQTLTKPDGAVSVVVKYSTHFYIVEGYGNFPLAGATLLITR